MCELCHAARDEDFIHYGPFFLIEECDTCGIPILVLKKHRAHLTLAEEMYFFDILEEHFPEYGPRGIGMRSIPDHWHEHLVEV